MFNKHLTLKQYRKKYRRYLPYLLKFHKSEVKKFDFDHEYYNLEAAKGRFNLDKFVLDGRKFILIGDTYYEIPRPFTSLWLKTLNKPTKATAAAVILAGVVFGILKGTNILNPIPVYSISYDCGEGTIGGENIKIVKGQRVVEVAPNPDKREGYAFDGWWKTRETSQNEYVYKDKISFPFQLTSDTTMYAKWDKSIGETCSINFYDSLTKESILNPLKFTRGIQVDPKTFEIPEKEDYKFVNWLDEKGTVKSNPFILNEDINLYADWNKIAFTLTFNTAGGSKPEGSIEKSGNYVIQHLNKLDVEPLTKRDDKTFTGWSTDGSKETLISYPLSVTNDNTTLIAVWGDAKEFVVTFDPNGGSCSTETLKCSHISTPPIPTRKYFEFKGWSKTVDGEAIDFSQPGGYQVTKNQTLYALWEQNRGDVTMMEGNTETVLEKRECVSEITSDPIATKVDHYLEGWHYKKDCKDDKITFPISNIKSNITIYANFIRNAYDVKIYNGSSTESTLVSSYSHVSQLTEDLKPSISKPNYSPVFYLSNDGGLNKKTIDFTETLNDAQIKPYIIDNVLNIYIDWKLTSYNLTLIYPEISGRTEKISKIVEVTKAEEGEETKVALSETYNPITVRDYKFKGWNTTEGSKETISSITLTGDTTIYAVYEQESYRLTVKYQYGDTKLAEPRTLESLQGSQPESLIPREDVIYDETTGINYGFSKFTDTEGKEIEFTSGQFKLEQDTIYIAQYCTVDKVDLYYKLSDSVDEVLYGEIKNQYLIEVNKIEQPPVVQDYVFDHFEDADGNTLAAGTVTNIGKLSGKKIIAKMTKNAFTVTLNPMGGSMNISKIEHLKSGDLIDESSIETPTKGTAVFQGWYKEEACTNPWNFSTDTVTEDTTLYAKWSAEVKSVTATFKITTDDYNSGARFVVGGVKQEGVYEKTVTKYSVGSQDYGTISYSGHSIDHWIDDSTSGVADFPYTYAKESKETYSFTCVFNELAEKCSVQLYAKEGKFTTAQEAGNYDTKIFTPTIGETFAEFKTEHSSELEVTYANHDFKYWEIYDISSGEYVELSDSYTFSSNIFLYAHYADTIEEKGKKSFKDANWATVAYHANLGLADLKEFYPDDFATTSVSAVGKTKTVTYGNTSYEVVVIGEGQDYTNLQAGSGQTALTFHFNKILTKACYGPSIKSSEATVNMWSTSIPREALMKDGTISSSFDVQLLNSVKTVEKKTLKGGHDSDYGSYVYTNDDFFLLSGKELGFDSDGLKEMVFTDSPNGTAGIEGVGASGDEAYTYYTTSYAADPYKRRIRYYGSETAGTKYWIRSPYNYSESTWLGTIGSLCNCINENGYLNNSSTDSSYWWKWIYSDCDWGYVPAFALGVYNA